MASRNKIGITGQFDDNISGKLAKVRDQFDRLGTSKGAKSVLQGVGMGVGITSWGLLTSAISGTVGVIGDAIKAAADEEQGIARMNAALSANVANWDGNTEAIERSIQARLDTGFADDQMRASLARLVGATHNVNRAFDVMNTAMDLARYKGISLEDASVALIKVQGGQYRALKELGIVLKEGATSTEALAEVQRVAGGQAEAYMETLSGQTEELSNRLDDLQETVGGAVTPKLNLMAGALLDVVHIADGGEVPIQDLTADLGALAGALRVLQVPGMVPVQAFADGTAKVEEMAAAAAELALQGRKTYLALHGIEGAAGDAAGPLGQLTDEADGTSDNLAKIKTQAKKAADQLRNVESAADDAREALFGSATGPQELTLELKNAKVEGNNLADKLRTLEGKKPTAQTRQDIRDTKLEIIDNQKKVVELEGELVKLGKVSLSAHKQTILGLGGAWDDSADDLARYLRLLSQVPGVKMPRSADPDDPNGAGRASGGPVQAGGIYTVGERGPETLVMAPAGGGFVIPNGGGGGGGATVVHTHINLDGREIARVVDKHLYYEAARAPRSSYAG